MERDLWPVELDVSPVHYEGQDGVLIHLGNAVGGPEETQHLGLQLRVARALHEQLGEVLLRYSGVED
jgi:hypothetical protein